MRMHRWSLGLLVASMLTWTALTGVAGWHAFVGGPGGGSSAPTTVEAASYTYDVAAPGSVRQVRSLTPEEVTVLESGQPLAAPAPTRPNVATRPVPRYSTSAGIDRRVKPAGIEETRSAPPPPEAAGPRGVVVLDPGHGRGDPGAVHYWPDGTYLTEGSTNLRTAHLLRTELQQRGFEVYLTREDEGVGPGRPLPRSFIISDLLWRAQLASAVDADVYLAINSNGASVKSIRGPETWYCGKHAQGSANERLAVLIQQAQMDTIAEYGYEAPDRGLKEDAYSHHSGDFCQFVVTREAPMPSALTEFLFLSNDQDATVLNDDRSLQLLAKHLAIAIDTFVAEHYGR
jgi:N-acetylmuramoyl-L-alanine amidase